MKKINIDKIIFLHLVFIAFLIPIFRDLVAPLVVTLTLSSFFIPFVHKSSFNKKYFILYFSLLSFFIIYVIGAFVSENQSLAWSDVFSKLSFLLFPINFYLISSLNFTNKKFKSILLSFVLGNVIVFFVSIFYAAKKYFLFHDTSCFFYNKISIFHHPSYSALFACFSAIICIMLILKNKIFDLTLLEKVFILVSIPLLSLFCFLLNSKAGIFALILSFIFVLIEFVFSQKKYLLSIFFVSAIAISIVLIVFFIPSSTNRIVSSYTVIKNILVNPKPINLSDTDGTADRLLIWKFSAQIVKENPWGVGTGDVKQALVAEYKSHNYSKAENLQLNSHNQYLQTLIANGVIGLFCMIVPFFILIYLSFKNKFYLGAYLIFLIAFNNLFESMFERQDGVFFYCFFWCLVVLYNLKLDSSEKEAISS